MGRECGKHGVQETCVQGFGGKPEGKRSIGKKPRRKWEHGIKIDCQNLDEGIDLIDLAQDRDKWRTLVNAVIEPSGSIKC